MGIPQCVVHSLYRSSTRGPEDDSVESKHVAPLSHYMFNFTNVVFDENSSPFKFVVGLAVGTVYRFCDRGHGKYRLVANCDVTKSGANEWSR